jgi:hypothetical protein
MTARLRDISRRLAALTVATALVVAGTPVAKATAGTVVADNGSGNGIASGAVVRTDPGDALVTVTNGFHFWAALDVTYVGGSDLLRPSPLTEDFGGIYAAGGLLGPNSTAAWDGRFTVGSQALVRIHYDLSSAGGAAALAANLLTIIANSLGASLSASSSSQLLSALQLITGMSSWADLVHQAQTNDIWGLVTSIEVLLGSKTGRDTIRQALGDLNVVASDASLVKAASVVGIIDWVYTLFDIYRSVLLGQNDGTVIFSVAPPSVAPTPAPTPTSIASPVPSAAAVTYAEVFSPTGSMATARYGQMATLLTDGRVLISGGISTNERPLTVAELYDPQTGTFHPTGSMTSARYDDSATLLTDGRVLIAGGSSSPQATLATAELYDPRTGTFSPTGSMTTARAGQTATLLTDGRVLIVGGQPQLSTAELYDPHTGTFSPTGSMAFAREYHTATLLADGRTLIIGGYDAPNGVVVWLASAELYDPHAGTFSPTGSMMGARFLHTATLLADGRVLALGGVGIQNGVEAVLTSGELYDPQTGTFSPTGSMAVPRQSHTATLLADGRVLVAGGDGTFNGAITALASAELYAPRSGVFVSTGPMTSARSVQTATLLANRQVLTTGGTDGNAPIATAELFR